MVTANSSLETATFTHILERTQMWSLESKNGNYINIFQQSKIEVSDTRSFLLQIFKDKGPHTCWQVLRPIEFNYFEFIVKSAYPASFGIIMTNDWVLGK